MHIFVGAEFELLGGPARNGGTVMGVGWLAMRGWFWTSWGDGRNKGGGERGERDGERGGCELEMAPV